MADITSADGLRRVLADTYSLYSKTHGYHWNVTGARFSQLHALFSSEYTEMWTALDEIAERIRALGQLAPQGFGALANLSAINGGDAQLDAKAMVEDLLAGHLIVIATLRAAMVSAEQVGDVVTVDVLTRRLASHEKHAWMLRATTA